MTLEPLDKRATPGQTGHMAQLLHLPDIVEELEKKVRTPRQKAIDECIKILVDFRNEVDEAYEGHSLNAGHIILTEAVRRLGGAY